MPRKIGTRPPPRGKRPKLPIRPKNPKGKPPKKVKPPKGRGRSRLM